MSRFLICSFALVLLYPAGIDMYLVGLPVTGSFKPSGLFPPALQK